MYRTIGIGSLLVFLIACNAEEKEQQQMQALMEAEVSRRVLDYENIIKKQCFDRVLEEAVRISDSLLILEAQLAQDTFTKPAKPSRPDKPELQVLKDTVPVKPFLQKNKKDSVQ